MSDPNPGATDPTPVPAAAPAPAPLPLAELFPLCFDWEHPRPLKIDIHRDLIAAGHDRIAVRRALGRYCQADRYRRALQAGAPRLDLQGQPAGVVTEKEAAHARQVLTPRAERAAVARQALPPDATPIPEEHLVSGRLELTVKFSALPRPLPVQGGIKIGLQTEAGVVTAILPPKVWRKLEQAVRRFPQWVAALSGSLERFADGEIALKHPAVQVFEKKARPEVAAAGKGPEPNGSDVIPPDAKASDANAPEPNAAAVKAPEPNAADVKASAGKRPEGEAAAMKAPDRNPPAAPAPAPPYPPLRLKGRGAVKAD